MKRDWPSPSARPIGGWSTARMSAKLPRPAHAPYLHPCRQRPTGFGVLVPLFIPWRDQRKKHSRQPRRQCDVSIYRRPYRPKTNAHAQRRRFFVASVAARVTSPLSPIPGLHGIQTPVYQGFRRARDYGFLHGNAKKRLSLVQLVLQVVIASRSPRPRPLFKCPTCQSPMCVVALIKPSWRFG